MPIDWVKCIKLINMNRAKIKDKLSKIQTYF